MNTKYLLLIVLTMSLAGCFPGSRRNSENVDYSEIAGTWKAENSPWEIVITKKGEVKSVVFPMGLPILKPNKTTTMEMKDGSVSSYSAGDFSVTYVPKERHLESTIAISDIDIKYLHNALKGTYEVFFVGTLSENLGVWDASYYEVFDYGPRFPQDEEDIQEMKIKFIKQKD